MDRSVDATIRMLSSIHADMHQYKQRLAKIRASLPPDFITWLHEEKWDFILDDEDAINASLGNRLKQWREIQTKKEKASKASLREWAFTFTTNKSPSEFQDEERAMIDATQRLFSQQSQPILEGSAYLEYTDAGAPHIHGWYRLAGGGRLYAKQFKRVWRLWNEDVKLGRGHQGGYHAPAGDKYKGYAAVEGRKIVSVPTV